MMHIRPHIAITALATPIFLAACVSEVQPDSDPAVPAHPPQEELARDIRTIVTGVKSPIQQEALAQAARIAPGQMSDALREVLVDATAFITYLDDRYETGDPRLDSLSRLLTRALQPHFSQKELSSDILSMIRSYEENDSLKPVRWARQGTAAWLVMHIPSEEMGEELRHTVIEGVADIRGVYYPMYTTRKFLLEALINQTPGGIEALASNPEEAVDPGILDERRMSYLKSFAREESMRRAEGPYIPPPMPKLEITPFDGLVAAIQAITEGETGDLQLKALGHVERIARRDPAQIGDTLYAAIVEAFRYMSEEAQRKQESDDPDFEARNRLLYALSETTASLENPDLIELFVKLDAYNWKCVGTHTGYLFSKFPDQSIPLITESISQSGKPSEKTPAALYILADMVIDYKRGWLDISQGNRNQLIAITRRFLEGDISLSWATRGKLDAYSDSNILSTAIHLTIALDDPELIDIVQELATNPDKIIALGIPDERVKYVQEDARRLLSWRPYMGGGDC